MADKVFNRYRNTSNQVQTYFTDEGTVTIYPGGTAVAAEGSDVARSRDTVIIQRNVALPNYEDQEALEDFSEQEDDTPQVPQHENTNPTNTSPAEATVEGTRTVLTDAFDGSGGTGAVNTSAADLTGSTPETPVPPADLSPKKTEEEAKDESKSETSARKTRTAKGS